MNEKFVEATTSTAFLLNLSMRNCNTLLRLAEDISWKERLYVVQIDSLRPLERRGLVYWKYDKSGRACGFEGLTKAGKLVCELLAEAGMTIKNTNTKSTLSRIERMKA